MTAISPSSGKTPTSLFFTLTLVGCGVALCWWVLVQGAMAYMLLPWYGWTQGRVVTAEVTSEMRSTGNGNVRPVFSATIVCSYDVDGATHHLRLSDPQEWYATKGSADVLIRRLPIGTRVPVFFHRQSPDTAKALRVVSLTYLGILAVLTIMTAWLIRREMKMNRSETGVKALASYIVSVPGLLAYAYFSAFWVLDGKTVFHVSWSRWSNAPDLLVVWLLFTLGFSLIVWAIADQKSKASALPAGPQDRSTPTF